MTEKEINVAISIACGGPFYGVKKRGYWYRPDAHGYTDRQSDAWHLSLGEAKKHEYIGDTNDDCVLAVMLDPDDYCNDLNAMHEAEIFLFQSLKTSDQIGIYRDALFISVGLNPIVWAHNGTPCNEMIRVSSATAAQRAEAFLKTIGKWTE